MRDGLSLGRVFGIEIRLDWSWFLIFLLVAWNLGVAFGNAHPDWGTGLQWGIAIVAALIFFGSVLVHELAHSLVARSQGVPVRRITLFLFGGVSNIQRHPPSPRAEFLITIVGPISSVLLGIVFLLGAGGSLGSMDAAVNDPQQLLADLSPLATLLLWLGSINLLLGVFNMIPGFPLDGGRILRSILWAITDNLRKATRWASYVGQAIAWGLIVSGVAMVFGVEVPFFGSGLINGLWLAFIGWFLSSASAQSHRQVVIEDVLEDVTASQMMRTDPPSVSAGATVRALVHEHMMPGDDYAFPVVSQGGQLEGLVTLSDVRKVPEEEWPSTPVQQIMTPTAELMTVSTDEEAADALRKLRQQDVRQLPVMENGNLAGLLRRRDVIRWLQLHTDEDLG